MFTKLFYNKDYERFDFSDDNHNSLSINSSQGGFGDDGEQKQINDFIEGKITHLYLYNWKLIFDHHNDNDKCQVRNPPNHCGRQSYEIDLTLDSSIVFDGLKSYLQVLKENSEENDN
jgi:hypothetical protein